MSLSIEDFKKTSLFLDENTQNAKSADHKILIPETVVGCITNIDHSNSSGLSRVRARSPQRMDCFVSPNSPTGAPPPSKLFRYFSPAASALASSSRDTLSSSRDCMMWGDPSSEEESTTYSDHIASTDDDIDFLTMGTGSFFDLPPIVENTQNTQEISELDIRDEPDPIALTEKHLNDLTNSINYKAVATFIQHNSSKLIPDSYLIRTQSNSNESPPYPLKTLMDGDIVISPRQQKFRIGEGMDKKVHFAINTQKNRFFANSVSSHQTADETARNEREITIQKLFVGNPFIAQILSVSRYTNRNGKNKISIWFPLYRRGTLEIINEELRTYLNENKNRKDFIRGILLGVDAIHKFGILHRDLKKANIYIEKEGEHFIPKIGDFGCAIKNTKATKDNIEGSPHYRAPENLATHHEKVAQSIESDIYAAGIVIGELINYFCAEHLAFHYTRETGEYIPNEPLRGTYEHLTWSMTRRDPAKRATLAEALAELDRC